MESINASLNRASSLRQTATQHRRYITMLQMTHVTEQPLVYVTSAHCQLRHLSCNGVVIDVQKHNTHEQSMHACTCKNTKPASVVASDTHAESNTHAQEIRNAKTNATGTHRRTKRGDGGLVRHCWLYNFVIALSLRPSVNDRCSLSLRLCYLSVYIVLS